MTKSGPSDIYTTPFWRLPSTWAVTAIRISILLVTQSGVTPGLPRTWWDSPSFTQILVRPSYTLSHLQEAVAIQKLGGGRFIKAYMAQRVRIPPLVLAGLMPVVTSRYAEISISILCILMDLVLAAMLESIARLVLFTNRAEQTEKESQDQEKLPAAIRPTKDHVFAVIQGSNESLITMESLPSFLAQVYYWSPITILSGSAYCCFQCLPGFLMIASIHEALRLGGSVQFSTFCLAVASYLEPHHLVFLFPVLAFPCWTGRRYQILFSFAFWSLCIHWLSYQLVGSKHIVEVMQATYGMGWNTIQPSLSVQWYFAIQLFSRFRGYFSTLLLGLPYVVVVPIAIRLHKYPIVLVSGCELTSYSFWSEISGIRISSP